MHRRRGSSLRIALGAGLLLVVIGVPLHGAAVGQTALGRLANSVGIGTPRYVNGRLLDYTLYVDPSGKLVCSPTSSNPALQHPSVASTSSPERVLIDLDPSMRGLIYPTQREWYPAAIGPLSSPTLQPRVINGPKLRAIVDQIAVDAPGEVARARQIMASSGPIHTVYWPGWAVTSSWILACVGFGLIIRTLIPQYRSVRWRSQNRCSACGYSLDNLHADTCPECGTATQRHAPDSTPASD